MCASACVCARARRKRERERACVCVCVCVRARERVVPYDNPFTRLLVRGYDLYIHDSNHTRACLCACLRCPAKVQVEEGCSRPHESGVRRDAYRCSGLGHHPPVMMNGKCQHSRHHLRRGGTSPRAPFTVP